MLVYLLMLVNKNKAVHYLFKLVLIQILIKYL